MIERSLKDAIQQFKSGIKKTDYGKVKGGKDYLSVAYRLKFCREYFGEKMSIQTDSIELSNGSHKFKANIYLNDKLVSVGESKQMSNKEKDFEKSQTVSIGRGLSLLGFFGDEIASKDEMESFLQDDKPFDDKKIVKDKTFQNGHKVNYPKDEPEEEKKIKPKLSIEQMANDWIDVLKKTATHSVSVGKFEQNLNPLRKEYINELQTIYTDLIQQQRIDTAYISLQKQITNRKQ
tara:strand:+ start:68 stop:769 length:702 start_codon:yes stop_codon:yes gene_type:complete